MAQLDLVEQLSDLLSTGDTRSVKSLLAEESFALVLVERAPDVIPIVSFYLNKETSENNPSVFRHCVKIIEKCAEKGNPKECLMEFLAQAESLEEVKFQAMIKPLQIVMLRIPEKKAPLMLCVFNVIYSFINTLPLPDFESFGGNSRLLIDLDEKYLKIKNYYQTLVTFYEPFVEELVGKSNSDQRIKNLKLAILQALFHLLGKPLVYLDLEFYEKGSSEVRSVTAKILSLVSKLQIDPFHFLAAVADKELVSIEEEEKIIKEFSSNEMKFSDLSVAVFFYAVFSEKLYPEIPCVYSKNFVVKNSIASALVLLRYKDTLVLRKGLLLIQAVLKKVEPGDFLFSEIDSDLDRRLMELLSNIAVFHEVEENRKLAVKLIDQYFQAYEPKAKFYILLYSCSIKTHSNITGFLTSMLTNTVKETFKDPTLKEFFTGKRLFDLLKLFCKLKDGVETDLIENKNQILSALNLMIFLTQRDRENFSGFWDYSGYFKDNFLAPLREALKLSKGHYELQLKTLDENPSAAEGPEFEVTVAGQQLGQMSIAEKKNVLNAGVNVFFLTENLLTRAEECIEAKPRN